MQCKLEGMKGRVVTIEALYKVKKNSIAATECAAQQSSYYCTCLQSSKACISCNAIQKDKEILHNRILRSASTKSTQLVFKDALSYCEIEAANETSLDAALLNLVELIIKHQMQKIKKNMKACSC